MRSPKKPHFNEVLEKIEFEILSGTLRPRERLIENDLIDRYGVTRGAIRKILKELDIKGLVTLNSNRGAVVSEPTKKEMQEIYELRLLVENSIMERVINNMDEKTFEQIEIYQKEFEEAVKEKKLKKMININKLFHQTLFKASGNSIVLDIISQLRSKSFLWQHYIIGYPERLKGTMKDHRNIVDCIKNRDVAGLQQVNEQHIRAGYEVYLKDMSRFGS